ncbi:MAG: hypothetical protein J5896_03015 [Alphaproteobacteria bacterium]|nr:hypothetical protein [Alphaproteobacteria bacterium]
MGIFSSHHTTNTNMNASDNYHLKEDETNDKTSSTTHNNPSSTAHSGASSKKTACGCGCGHKAKPIEEDVYEVTEEWDY